MKGFHINMDGAAGVSIDWSGLVSDADLLAQKLAVNMLTDVGSDVIDPARGTNLLRRVTNGRVYDLQTAQHELNFAALSAKAYVRANEDEAWPPVARVGNFRVVLEGVENGRLVTSLIATAVDGTTVGKQQAIA